MNRHDGQQQKQKDKQQQKVKRENRLSTKSPENTQIRDEKGYLPSTVDRWPTLTVDVNQQKRAAWTFQLVDVDKTKTMYFLILK